MTKANKPGPGSQKPASGQGKAGDIQKKTASTSATAPAKTAPPTPPTPPAHRGKSGGKYRKSTIGGTAVTGSKSTIPKEIPTSGPAQDRPEMYNRDSRRRMQHMGTGPYNDTTPVPARKRYEKKVEERKKRQEAVKKTVVTKGPSTNVKIGNKNTYFLLTVLGIIVLIIVIALIVRHPF
ncbi:MAG TPA: hypothetical protein VGT44_16790 [Ktedonobacteraceae bacterium]|nr:hypothetical protein [Ktedonobacteraceae bacterium]